MRYGYAKNICCLFAAFADIVFWRKEQMMLLTYYRAWMEASREFVDGKI